VGVFGLVVMIVLTIGVVVLILVFERKRAREIQRDLGSDRAGPAQRGRRR